MEYSITGKFDETYLDECLAMWRYSSVKAFNSVKSYAVYCVISFSLAMIQYLETHSVSIFTSAIFLACLFLLITQIASNYQSKYKVRQMALARNDKFKALPGSTRTLIFKEDTIVYIDPVMRTEINWKNISHYQVYGRYVVFFMHELSNPVFSMDKNNIPASVEHDLFGFINSKIAHSN